MPNKTAAKDDRSSAKAACHRGRLRWHETRIHDSRQAESRDAAEDTADLASQLAGIRGADRARPDSRSGSLSDAAPAVQAQSRVPAYLTAISPLGPRAARPLPPRWRARWRASRPRSQQA